MIQEDKLNISQNPWSASGQSLKRISRNDICVVNLDSNTVTNLQRYREQNMEVPALIRQTLSSTFNEEYMQTLIETEQQACDFIKEFKSAIRNEILLKSPMYEKMQVNGRTWTYQDIIKQGQVLMSPKAEADVKAICNEILEQFKTSMSEISNFEQKSFIRSDITFVKQFMET